MRDRIAYCVLHTAPTQQQEPPHILPPLTQSVQSVPLIRCSLDNRTHCGYSLAHPNPGMLSAMRLMTLSQTCRRWRTVSRIRLAQVFQRLQCFRATGLAAASSSNRAPGAAERGWLAGGQVRLRPVLDLTDAPQRVSLSQPMSSSAPTPLRPATCGLRPGGLRCKRIDGGARSGWPYCWRC
jgi:hypothetical protein